MRGLATRLVSIGVGAPLLLVILWKGGWPLAVLLGLLGAVAWWEMEKLGLTGAAASPRSCLGYLAAGVMPAVALRWGPGVLWLAGLTCVILLGIVAKRYPFRTAWVLLSFPHLLLIRQQPRGWAWVILLMAMVWGYDAGGYLFGLRWGRRRMCPDISPGKTWEGAAGGLLTSGLAAGLWAAAARMSHAAMVLWPPVVLVGQLGDLYESWLKRRAGVKDSSQLIPGHGGVLDRFDSLMTAAPVYYLLQEALQAWGMLG